MPRITLTALFALSAAVAGGLMPAGAGAQAYRPDELVVRYAPGTGTADRERLQRAVGARPEALAGPDTRVLRIIGGRSVTETARRSHR